MYPRRSALRVERRMFSGLRSLWTIPCWVCRYSIPLAISAAVRRRALKVTCFGHFGDGRKARRWIARCRDPKSQCSITTTRRASVEDSCKPSRLKIDWTPPSAKMGNKKERKNKQHLPNSVEHKFSKIYYLPWAKGSRQIKSYVSFSLGIQILLRY